jgi:hypothetical protein
MKLWILQPLVESEEPWEIWYDKAFGFVVRADNENHARALASQEAGAEGGHAWLDEALSSCRPLESEGAAEVIMKDFHAT